MAWSETEAVGTIAKHLDRTGDNQERREARQFAIESDQRSIRHGHGRCQVLGNLTQASRTCYHDLALEVVSALSNWVKHMVGERSLDRDTVERAFDLMGEYLRDRHVMGEICLYGGAATLFLVSWRRVTNDVDAIIRENHGEVIKARNHAARKLSLPDSWLNEGVSVYTSLNANPSDHRSAGSYPRGGNPGLRVMVAKPEYLFAMKAIARSDRGAERDLADLIRLGQDLGVATREDVVALVERFYPSHDWPIEPDVALEIAEAVVASKQVQP